MAVAWSGYFTSMLSGWGIFIPDWLTRRYPVFKVDPAIAELAKSGRPQWIVVTWSGNIATDPVAIHLVPDVYGLATLRKEHVLERRNGVIELEFVGKSGKLWSRSLVDPEVLDARAHQLEQDLEEIGLGDHAD